MRYANVIAGLADAGSVDVFCTVDGREDLPPDGPAAPPEIDRLLVHHRPSYRATLAGVGRWFRTGWPRAVSWREWRGAAAALQAFSQPPYDLIWYSTLGPWLALRQAPSMPAIVDLNDLEDEKLQGLLDRAGRPRTWRRRAGRPFDSFDVWRWRRLQRQAAEEAQIVVCSDVDRNRFVREAAIIPNGYDLVAPVGARGGPHPPTLTMVGLMVYPPNLDAAEFLANEIFPLVRDRQPGAELLLVGRHDGLLDGIARQPGVRVTGMIDDVGDALRRTSVVVAPIRFGSGTRIKILEALAYKLPVVSTELGCEGLAVVDGESIVLGETAGELAAACVDLLEDPARARAIGEAGHRVWAERYQWSTIRRQIRTLAISAVRP